MILKQTRTDKTCKVKLKKVYQIVDISHLVLSKIHQEIHPFLEIGDINLAKIIKTSYTSIKEKVSLEKLLYLLVYIDEQILRNVYDLDDLIKKWLMKQHLQQSILT